MWLGDIHIQQIIDLSFLWSFCRSLAVMAHVFLPRSNAECTHASNALPVVVKDMCLDVRICRSFLNFPQAVQHLVAMVLPSTQHVAQVAEVGVNVK
jgi:hypothetical protein